MLKKKNFKGFDHIWAWWPAWAYAMFPLPTQNLALIGQAASEKMFENNVLYVYIVPKHVTDNALRSILLYIHKKLFAAIHFPLNGILTVFTI